MIAVQGRNGNVYRWNAGAAAWRIIGCNASISLDITEDLIPCATADTGEYSDYETGLTDYTIQLDNVITLAETTKTQAPDLINDRKNVQLMKVEFVDSSSNAMVIEFSARVQNITLGAPTLGSATWSTTMKGCGEFTLTETTITPSPSTSDVESLYLTGDGTDTLQDNDLINISELLMVFSAGQFFQPITVGTPTGSEVKYTASTGELEFESVLVSGQQVLILYKP